MLRDDPIPNRALARAIAAHALDDAFAASGRGERARSGLVFGGA